MKLAAVVVIALTLNIPAWAVGDVPSTVRPVQGQTLMSGELPAAQFRVADGFRYLGGQRFALFVHTDAEQDFFVDADAQGRIRRLYWFQFEHNLPGNNSNYHYTPTRTLNMGGLLFVADAKIYTDYPGVKPAHGSDVERARAFLAAHGLSLPHTAMRARLFNAPGKDRHSELMIIYAEAMPADKMPADAGNDMPADGRYPGLSQALMARAQQTLKILPAP